MKIPIIHVYMSLWVVDGDEFLDMHMDMNYP